MGTPSSDEFQPPGYLIQALRRVLRPVVRLLIEKQITLPRLNSLLKEVYVEVAEKEFQTEGKEQTDSRISLLTGVHRKDVRRLRHAELDFEPPATISLGAELVGRWTTEKAYRDSRGRPRPLQRHGEAEGEISFDQLAAEVSRQDIRPRAVLDELIRIGAVVVDDKDRLVLKAEALVPAKGEEEKAYFFGQNGADHLAAAVHNLCDGEDPYFDRSAYYDGLSEASVRKLRGMAETMSMKALQKLYDEAARLHKQDRKKSDAVHRINYGIWVFSEKEPSE